MQRLPPYRLHPELYPMQVSLRRPCTHHRLYRPSMFLCSPLQIIPAMPIPIAATAPTFHSGPTVFAAPLITVRVTPSRPVSVPMPIFPTPGAGASPVRPSSYSVMVCGSHVRVLPIHVSTHCTVMETPGWFGAAATGAGGTGAAGGVVIAGGTASGATGAVPGAIAGATPGAAATGAAVVDAGDVGTAGGTTALAPAFGAAGAGTA